MKIRLGLDRASGKPVQLPLSALHRHLHLVGASGSGKTTALITLLTQLFCLPGEERCVIVLDRLGGFSQDLLRWFSSPFCPMWVRKKLVYIEVADEDRCVPLHPLSHRTPGEAYYRTARAMEIVLRGWAAQDLSQQPRLARWMFNDFYGAALLGLCIADCTHFLYAHSPYHETLIRALPPELQREWAQILTNKNQADIQLESTRNRLKPFFVSNVLKWMFSSTTSRFDVLRWMREKKIVLVNLAPKGRIANLDADTIGGLIVNEVLSIARSLEPQDRRDTLLVLDEFQRFINSDLEFALAEARQLKVQLVLSHQSFSQLEQTDGVDLTSLIFQCGSRLILNSRGPDAVILAEELAGFTFDPMKVKDEIWHTCQRITGHKIIELQSNSHAESLAENWSESYGRNWSAQKSVVRRDRELDRVRSDGSNSGGQEAKGKGGGLTQTSSYGSHQALQPIYQEYEQIASRNYFSFDEQKYEWGKRLRQLKTGQGLFQVVNNDALYEVAIDNWAVGALTLPWETILNELPREAEEYTRLLEENYLQECFVSPQLIERETAERLERVVRAPLTLLSGHGIAPPEPPDSLESAEASENPLA